MLNVRRFLRLFEVESSMFECSNVPSAPSKLDVRVSLCPLYSRSALSEMSFRHQVPGQRMHLTAV